jgi:triacylglycerol lipase
MLPTRQIGTTYQVFEDCNSVPFNPSTSTFALNNAWWMAECSRFAYLDPTSANCALAAGAGFTDIKFFSKKEIAVYILSNDNVVVVAFRGTNPQELNDDFIDLDFVMVDEAGSHVHQGFRDALDLNWADVVNYITPLLATRELWWTGHSLGAAMATLAAERMPGRVCYNFGCPRVGDWNFIEQIKQSVYRFVHNEDIVPSVPPPVFYRHTMPYFFIARDGLIYQNPNFITWFKYNGFKAAWLYMVGLIVAHRSIVGAIEDHDMNNYAIYVWNNIERGIV